MNDNAMTWVIRYGICWSRICQDNAGNGVASHRITGGSSMACFGFYAQEHRGGIYRRATGNGVLYISVFADGVIREPGKSCWKSWLMNLILNGSWLMRAIARYILMPLEQRVETRTWVVQKGAQYQDSPCRGCKWYAGPSTYHRGYPSWLQRSYSPNWRNIRGNITGRSWLWHQSDHCVCCWCWNEYCDSGQAKSQTPKGLWSLFVPASSFGGKCFFASETLAWYCHAICQKYSIFFGSSANSLHCYLVCHFSLILCRHYLIFKFRLFFRIGTQAVLNILKTRKQCVWIMFMWYALK